MSRSAMSLTAAVCGFVHLLLTVTVVQCQNGWDVKCRQTYICAVIGSTVEVSCTYSFPTQVNNNKVTIKERFWFRKVSKGIYVDLRSDPDYSDRVEYECENNNCLLRIKDLRKRDSAKYKFRFTTNQESGKYNGPQVTLSVTGLQVQVRRSDISRGSNSAELQCDSRCPLLDSLSYTWMNNQQIVREHTSKTFSFVGYSDTSVSCGLRDQQYRSPAVLLNNHWEVNYAAKEICAFKGSTVEISCSYRYPTRRYKLDTKVYTVFWFTTRHFRDLRYDHVYLSRVRYGGGENNSTLTISHLTERDSAVYKFRFTTNQPEGRLTGEPGVKLSVTDPQLQIRVRKSIFRPDYLNWIELTCQSNCQLSDHPSYIWYKNGQTFSEEQKNYVLLQTIISADRYHCAIKHYEGFPSPPVYVPKPPVVSVSPPGEIVEGSSVTLTCSSDANPAANYTWYKNTQFIQSGTHLVFTSIQPSHSGQYSCLATNKLGTNQSHETIDVKYAPKRPSVSVSPPGEIVEGNSVNLTCSSDANPEATYTWYKDNEDSPKASGQTFTIIDFRTEHSGKYYCVAQNVKGLNKSNSTVLTIVPAFPKKLVAIGLSLLVVLLTVPLCAFLLIRKWKTSKSPSQPQDEPDNSERRPSTHSQQQQEDLNYASVRFVKTRTDPIYSNMTPAGTSRQMETEEVDVEYVTVKFHQVSSSPRRISQEPLEDSFALYSTVKKI